MDKVFFSFITGLFYTSGLFFLCLFVVAGAKVLIKSIFNKPISKPQPQKVEKPPEKKSKSIEINADEVERIYFKKSS